MTSRAFCTNIIYNVVIGMSVTTKFSILYMQVIQANKQTRVNFYKGKFKINKFYDIQSKATSRTVVS